MAWSVVVEPVEIEKRAKRRATAYRERKQDRHRTRQGRGRIARLRRRR